MTENRRTYTNLQAYEWLTQVDAGRWVYGTGGPERGWGGDGVVRTAGTQSGAPGAVRGWRAVQEGPLGDACWQGVWGDAAAVSCPPATRPP